MKTYNKSNFITGIILIIMAALFSISLLLQLLNFGVNGPGSNNLLYDLGKMLVTVYGFSSILVPIFLLICGISSFVSKWTSQKTMYLITAILPFFTSVVTEKICRIILKNNADEAIFVKLSIAIVTGLMLVIIEIMGAGVIAERVNQRLFHKNKKTQKYKSNYVENLDIDDFEEAEESEEDNEDELDYSYDSDDEEISLDEDENEEDFSETVKFNPIKKKNIFGKALSKIKMQKEEKDDSFEELKTEAKALYEGDIPTIEDYANISDKESSEENTEIEERNEDYFEDKNPASIITQEEYAALITPETFGEVDESVEDNNLEDEIEELEWPNLPPQPENLPLEYEEDTSDFEIENDSEETKNTEEFDFSLEFDEADEKEELNEEDEVFQLGNVFEEVESEKKESENPYDDAKFIDTVVHKNSVYPTGISLQEDNQEEETKKIEKVKKVSPYSSRISLEEEEDVDSFNEKQEELSLDDDILDDELNNYEDAFELDNTEDTLEEFEDLSEIIHSEEETQKSLDGVFNQISSQEENVSFGKAASNMFADMDADIRKEMGSDDYLEEETDILTPLNDEADNLTADELTDFFNAQQKENTPVTQKIEGNLPKTNRATKKGPYVIPSDLLTEYEDDQYWIIDDKTKEASINLQRTLSEFNIEADIIGIKKGPVVTMFEILPAPGVRLSKIVALQDNIALSLAASSVRIVAPIPGKQAVGIEVPNKNRSIVSFREIIEQNLSEYNKMAIPVILGKDILGKSQLIDLAKTPHMLIAGATGSGKSVCVNSIILSILYKRSFKDVKLILVDPKVVELKLYNNIPHLLTPVITEPKKAIQALQYCLCEMERRYALLDGLGVRDISSYNARIKERQICTEKLPYIVVIIDEFADLMATSGRELESTVARLTAMSRAVGIHLVLATQRPSVNVITGLIKANIPSRVAFMVASRTDSNIIIDSVGAEKLLGRGDMLYASATDPYPVRIQGTYISDQEVEDVVEYVKQFGEPDYIDDEIFVPDEDDSSENLDLFGNSMDEDPLYDQALEIVVQAGKASASYIQRRLKIGYNRAARLVEEMEERGIVGPANGSKPREVIYVP